MLGLPAETISDAEANLGSLPSQQIPAFEKIGDCQGIGLTMQAYSFRFIMGADSWIRQRCFSIRSCFFEALLLRLLRLAELGFRLSRALCDDHFAFV